MSRPTQGIDANTEKGRVLLALRPGSMTPGQLRERFPSSSVISALVRDGLIVATGGGRDENTYRLTDYGRRVCPTRRVYVPGISKKRGA